MRRDVLVRVLAIVGGAAVLVIALVVASRVGHHSSNKPNASNIQLDSINEMLSGIPQKGIALGNTNAKLTLVEFADPQCPFCGEWGRTVLPTLIEKYVRSGQLRIEYQGLAFLDNYSPVNDSDRLLRLAQAAGLQNKLWNVVQLEFENQGDENSGYATDPLMKAIVEAVRPGLDVKKVLATWNTSAVVPMIETADALYTKVFGRQYSTPDFLLGSTGSKQTVKIRGARPLQTFTKAIDAQLKK